MPEDQALAKAVEKLKLGGFKRHIFLCTGPSCCTPEQGLESWEYLKRRLKELGLADGLVNRTKVNCFRICCEGPISVVYPEGTWYCHATPEVCETIIQQHLVAGQIAKEHVFAANPLPAESTQAARQDSPTS